jgi:tetraacyldisaccharide-1-P 4'-kinase
MTVRKSVLLIGNFLSGGNGSRQVCEELNLRLTLPGWHVVSASRTRNRMWRPMDFALAVLAKPQSVRTGRRRRV